MELPTGNKPSPKAPKPGTLAYAEFTMLQEALAKYQDGTFANLCFRLGIKRATLYYKLKKYGLSSGRIGRTWRRYGL